MGGVGAGANTPYRVMDQGMSMGVCLLCSLTHSLTHSLAHSLHSLHSSLTRSLTRSFVDSLIQSFTPTPSLPLSLSPSTSLTRCFLCRCESKYAGQRWGWIWWIR